MRLVVIGAPGAGKGTQAKLLARRFGVPHVSTGDLLRGHIEKGDNIGIASKVLMDAGLLVPDAIIIDLVRAYIDKKSFIFDGFPRTLVQAEILDKILDARAAPLYRVVYVKLADDIIVERMAGRLNCAGCGTSYNKEHNPPVKAYTCDRCRGRLYVRDDDSEPVVRRRLESYYALTKPIIDYYDKRQLVFEVSGTGSIDEIADAIVGNLEPVNSQSTRGVNAF